MNPIGGWLSRLPSQLNLRLPFSFTRDSPTYAPLGLGRRSKRRSGGIPPTWSKLIRWSDEHAVAIDRGGLEAIRGPESVVLEATARSPRSSEIDNPISLFGFGSARQELTEELFWVFLWRHDA